MVGLMTVDKLYQPDCFGTVFRSKVQHQRCDGPAADEIWMRKMKIKMVKPTTRQESLRCLEDGWEL